uniref:Chemokine (C-C motif) ligand 34b, duplicate 4 n=1 Tax=Lepisosteus oculatus TaxID=7918 RepID=W5MIX4_LEPOC
ILCNLKFASFLVALIISLVGCVALASANYRRPTKVTTSCCKAVSKTRIKSNITGYKLQNALKPCVEAVIFITNNQSVCSDPTVRWVKRKIQVFSEVPR